MSVRTDAELQSVHQRISEKIQAALKDVEHSNLRPLRARVFRCSAQCCEDNSLSAEGVQSCVDNCMSQMEEVDNFISHEMNELQNRFNRCGMSCADEIRDALGESSRKPENSDKSRRMLVDCVGRCTEEIEKMYFNPFDEMPLSAAPYREHYHCYPITSCFNPNPRSAAMAKDGGKIILPPSALHHLTRLNIDFPMFFKLSFGGRSTHCGVLEFTAPENCCFLPDWMCTSLGIAVSGQQLISVEYVNLPVATFVRFQPETSEFYEIYDHKAVLERALRSFACLTQGERICIHYNNCDYWLNILKTEPNHSGFFKLSILECDMHVDFAEAVKTIKPKSNVREKETLTSAGQANGNSTAKSNSATGNPNSAVTQFPGTGRRLDGKVPSPQISKGDPRSTTKSLQKGIPDYDYNPRKLQFFRRPTTESPPPDDPQPSDSGGSGEKKDEGSSNSFQPFSGKGRSLRPGH